MRDYDDEWIEKEGLSPSDTFDNARERHPDIDEYNELNSTKNRAEEIDEAYLLVRSAFRSHDFQPTIPRSERWRRKREIEGAFSKSFFDKLNNGELVAYGRKGNRQNRYTDIRATLWPHLELSFEDSTAEEIGAEGPILYDIRVFEKHLAPQKLTDTRPVEETPRPAFKKKTASVFLNEIEVEYPEEFEEFYREDVDVSEFGRWIIKLPGTIHRLDTIRKELGIMRQVHRNKK